MNFMRTLVIVMILSPGMMTLNSVAEPILTDGSKTMVTPEAIVKGDVLMTEGEFYVVRDVTGHEVRVHVNSETKMEGVIGKLKVGDKIEAKVTSEGHATSITLQIQQSDTIPAAPRTPNIPSVTPPGER